MKESYESSDPLQMPFECFTYDSLLHPFPVHEHWHYFAEILMARKGTLHITLGVGDEYLLKPGELFFVCPQVNHAISCAENDTVSYDVIKLDLNQLNEVPSYAPGVKTIFLDAERKQLPMLFSADTVRKLGLGEMVTECIKEYGVRMYGYDMVIRSNLYLITTALIRCWMKDGYRVQNRDYQSDLLSSVDSITAHIDRHIRETLRVEDLAAFCGMSYPSFARKFRELYGISCKEYITRVRVSKVEHYLLFTNADLTYVSQETGYSDCSHMIKDFKRLRGMTPGRFRAEHRE